MILLGNQIVVFIKEYDKVHFERILEIQIKDSIFAPCFFVEFKLKEY